MPALRVTEGQRIRRTPILALPRHFDLCGIVEGGSGRYGSLAKALKARKDSGTYVSALARKALGVVGRWSDEHTW